MSDKAASKEPMTTRSGRSVGLGSADGSETFHLSHGAQPSTAAALAAPTPSEEEDTASKESDIFIRATPMDTTPVRSPPTVAEGVELNTSIQQCRAYIRSTLGLVAAIRWKNWIRIFGHGSRPIRIFESRSHGNVRVVRTTSKVYGKC